VALAGVEGEQNMQAEVFLGLFLSNLWKGLLSPGGFVGCPTVSLGWITCSWSVAYSSSLRAVPQCRLSAETALAGQLLAQCCHFTHTV